MNVSTFIEKLTAYAAQSPENANAEIMLQFFDEQCYGILGANDAKGMPGQHLLILVPDLNTKIGVRALRIQ